MDNQLHIGAQPSRNLGEQMDTAMSGAPIIKRCRKVEQHSIIRNKSAHAIPRTVQKADSSRRHGSLNPTFGGMRRVPTLESVLYASCAAALRSSSDASSPNSGFLGNGRRSFAGFWDSVS